MQSCNFFYNEGINLLNLKKYFIMYKFLILCLSFFFISCKEETRKPKVTYNATPKKEVVKNNSENILLADLPIQMDGTSVLLHPIGEFSVAEGVSKSSYSSSDKESFKISNSSENEITGYLSNIKFQEVGSDSLKVLTDKPVLIETVTYLKTIADKTKRQVLVYTLADMDTNNDDKLDSDDIKALYLSEINGNNFIKISADFQELIDWNVIESKNRLYFRTIEDTNKNGKFDKNDILHYHFIDLNSKDWKVADYSPVN
jgi:hypothetical protein